MRITITKEVQNKQSGWEHYSPGAKITVRDDYAADLIEMGFATGGWTATTLLDENPSVLTHSPATPSEIIPAEENKALEAIKPAVDYSKMSVKELRRLAQAAGFVTTRKKKADLIKALEEQ